MVVMSSMLKISLQPQEKHVLLAFLIIQEKLVLVIITCIQGHFADNIFESGSNGGKDLIHASAPAKRNTGVGIECEMMGQSAMISGNELNIFLLAVRAAVINPRLRKF